MNGYVEYLDNTDLSWGGAEANRILDHLTQ